MLNKRHGHFTHKDEARLRAFTAQIAIALENAKLFDDVLRVQNYNEAILRSTSNAHDYPGPRPARGHGQRGLALPAQGRA